MPLGAKYLEEMYDFIVWYAKDKSSVKYNQLFIEKDYSEDFHWNNYEDASGVRYKINKQKLHEGFAIPDGARRFRLVSLWPASFDHNAVFPVEFRGKSWLPAPGQCYPTSPKNMERLAKTNHLEIEGNYLRKVLYEEGAAYGKLTSNWDDTIGLNNHDIVQWFLSVF